MSYLRITAENAEAFRIGQRVRFYYGVMHGEDFGRITGHRTNQWGTELSAVTDTGEEKWISGITDIGIGVYLVPDSKEDAQPDDR